MTRSWLIPSLLALVILGDHIAARGQFRVDPFTANESALVEKIRSIRAGDPKITPDDLVIKANENLVAMGLDYYLSMNPTTCATLVDERAKNPKKVVRLTATLQSVGADKTKIAIPEPLFAVAGCKGCFVKFAMLEVTAGTFVTKVQNVNIKFAMPPEVRSTEVWLLNSANDREIVSRWRVPSKLQPIGLSSDQNVVYLGFADPELKDLSLAVFTEGTFEFATRKEADDNGKPEPAKDALPDGRKKLVFTQGDKKYAISYEPACEN